MSKLSRSGTEVKSNRRASGKEIVLAAGEEVVVGVDAHRRDYKVCVWSCQRDAPVAEWVCAPQVEALERRLAAIRGQVREIVYEAGPTGFWLARGLQARGWRAGVISAAHLPQAAVGPDKSDRLDARELGQWGSRGLLHAVDVPTAAEEAERELFRGRDRLCRQVRRIKQQIKSFLLFHGIEEPAGLKTWSGSAVAALRRLTLRESLRWGLDELLENLGYFQERLRLATRRLRQVAARAECQERVARLRTIPGVGEITALGFALELPRPERFASGRELGRYLGLSPRVSSSGETTRQQGRHRSGQERLRAVMIEAAWQWRRRDALALARYNRVLSNTGNGNKAITALARKLAIVMWRIDTTGERYCPGLLHVPPAVFEGMKRRAARAA